MIYLDNSATSPIDEEVRDAMLPYLSEEFGNPSSKYYCKATNAKNAIEDAREKVAKLLGAEPEEIIFTAGATESSNFIIKGYLDYRKLYGDGRNHVITSLVEHKANAETLKMATVETAKEAERSVVDIATLKKCNQQLISSISEVVKIHEQGAKRRQDAETELVKVEQELKQALLAAGSK